MSSAYRTEHWSHLIPEQYKNCSVSCWISVNKERYILIICFHIRCLGRELIPDRHEPPIYRNDPSLYRIEPP